MRKSNVAMAAIHCRLANPSFSPRLRRGAYQIAIGAVGFFVSGSLFGFRPAGTPMTVPTCPPAEPGAEGGFVVGAGLRARRLCVA